MGRGLKNLITLCTTAQSNASGQERSDNKVLTALLSNFAQWEMAQ